MRLSRGILLEIIVIFTGLNSKIEWGKWGPCTRLNGEIEQFLHEAEWEAEQGSFRQEVVCVSLQKCGL